MGFFKYLKNIDFFGEPIQFCLKMKHSQTSLFSAILTILFIGAFVSIAYQGFIDLVLKNHITSYTMDIYNLSPPAIDFSDYNMKFAFTFSDPTLNDAKYFKVELNQYSVTRNSSGNVKKLKFPSLLGQCDLKDFGEELKIALNSLPINFSRLLCPMNNPHFYIKGKFSGNLFNYVSLKISKCQNTDTITCASEIEIANILQKNENKIYFNIYFSNNIIDINNIQNYLTRFLDDRIYVLLDFNYYKEKNVYFTSNEVLTDSSIFQNDQDEYDKLTTFTFENNYDESTIMLHKTNDPMADVLYSTIYFRSNFLSKQQIRIVGKLTDYLGYIGGFWSGLYMIFSRLGRKYNRDKFLMKIAKNIYCFPSQSKNFSNKPSTVSNFKEKLSVKNRIKPQNNVFDTAIVQKKKSFKQILEEYIKINNAATKLFSKAKVFILKIFSPKILLKNYKTQKKIEKKAKLTILKDIDLIHLLGKIKEIDKLTSILLDNNQKNLFEYIPKAKIQLENNNHFLKNRASLLFMKKTQKINKFTKKISEETFQLKDFYKLYDSYKHMMEDNDPIRKDINRKIIKTLEPDLLEIFRNENVKSMEKSKYDNSSSKFIVDTK